MSKVFFTSDTHFGHSDEIFVVPKRGISSISEHSRAVIDNWNSVVGPEDEVYHLGDVIVSKEFEPYVECVGKLNGHIHVIKGNHDTKAKLAAFSSLSNIVDVNESLSLDINGIKLVLSHRPIKEEGPKDYICLCGHTHTSDAYQLWNKFACYNVGLDAHGLRPVSLEEIINCIKIDNKLGGIK